jgi:aspartyl/asparaginyl-tRNA synthetase
VWPAAVLLGLSDGTGIVDCTVRSNSGTGMVRPCFEVAQKLQLGDAIAVYGELYTSLERREVRM